VSAAAAAGCQPGKSPAPAGRQRVRKKGRLRDGSGKILLVIPYQRVIRIATQQDIVAGVATTPCVAVPNCSAPVHIQVIFVPS